MCLQQFADDLFTIPNTNIIFRYVEKGSEIFGGESPIKLQHFFVNVFTAFPKYKTATLKSLYL